MFGMFKGVVKWFDARDGKKFGFVVCEGYLNGTECPDVGKEFFFHFNDGEFIVAGGSKPEFVGKKTIRSSKGIHQLRDPHPDDILVFTQSLGKQGYKASPWTFVSRYESAFEQIASRPMYRVLQSSGAWGEAGSPENPKDAQVRWQGSDMEELKKLFPIPIGRSPGADPLLSFWSSDDGFEIRRWWEKKNAEGEWEQCPDPRNLTGVLRQFERITNRW